MKKNILNTMKQFAKYICVFLMVAGMNVNAWGTTESMDFSSSTWAWPQGYNAYETTHTKGAHQVIVKYAQKQTTVGVILNSKSSDAYMLLPAFPGTVSSITIATCSGSASNQVINLYDNSTNDLLATTTIATGGGSFTFTTGVNSYNLPYSGVSSGTIIRIEGDGVNVQLSSISVTHNGSAMPTIDVDDYVLNMSTTTIRGTLEDGEITAEVPFSVTINNPAYGYPIIYFALENISPSSDLTLYSMSHIDGNGWWDDPDPDGWNMYKYTDYEDPWVSYTERFSFTYYCVEAGTYTAKFRLYDEDINELAEASLTFIITEPCTDRSITMSNFSKDFGNPDFVPTHTVSAGSGTKTWTSSNTDVATIVDGKVHIVASGTTTIGLSVAADDTYCEVSQSCTMTVNALVPTVTAFTGTSSSPTSITLTNAQVSNKGGAAISAYGYIYSTTASTAETLKLGETGVSTATVASADIAASTNFASKTVSGLTTGTTYYVRAYATNSAGTGYSAVQSVKTIEYTDYKFSCADWELTGPSGDIVFITSTASKTVRSQEAFHVTASGLPASTELTFTTFPANTRFTFKKADGTAISTDTYGKVNTDFYVYYTPTSGDTSDGLDVFSTLYVSVTGEPRKDTLDTKTVIGRHLPADFVIAAKKNGKWYAMPSNMTNAETATPVEIAVDDADNPTMAYTATTNMYSIAQPAASEYITLKMKGKSDYPLFGSSGSGTSVGSSTQSDAEKADIGNSYLWRTIQINRDASITTRPQNAVYRLYNKASSVNNDTLRIKNSPMAWGLYNLASNSAQDIHLIPASAATVVEAYAVEWGQHGMVVEVDAQGISATKVKAKLSGSETGLITLSETKTSVKNRDTKYNYTVDFGVGFNLAASTALGKILTLEWYNSSDVMVGVTSIELPKIIATSATMSSINSTQKYWKDLEVHVLPGTTLTANTAAFSNDSARIRELHIYPGATVKVTPASGAGKLMVDTMILRNGWTRVGTKEFDVARLYLQPYIDASHKAATLYHTKAYLDWYIDYDQYYPIAVPFWVATSSITYKNTKSAASAGVIIRYYDGERRAEHEQQNQDENWVLYNWDGTTPAMPANLEPSKGYAMTAKRPSGKAFSIVRMPMTFTNPWTALGEHGSIIVDAVTTHKDQVTVTGYGKGSASWYAMGWNFVANPYMCTFNGDDDGISGKIEMQNGGSVKYATIPDLEFQNYYQVPIAEANLKPASGFFIQANNEDPQTITFNAAKIVPPSAPQFRATPQPLQEQEAYIRLSNESGKDQMGIIIGQDYTADYEPNADLAKVLGSANSVKTYMRYGNMDMAYVAINQALAQEWIPVTVNIPAAGEYTYSLTNSSVVGQLEGVYLIDYATDIITNLIEQNYIFNATTAGTITNRFAINAIVGERQTPTPIDAVEQDHKNTNEPIKFIYRDKMYIMFNGVIYDATGKKVR